MKKNYFLFLVVSLLMFSCTENGINQQTSIEEFQSDQQTILKESFSTALMRVLRENVMARTVIKDEALKKMDKDYDVIYDWIKDINLTDGETIESHILKYMAKSDHDLLLDLIPNLTIFIPTLPEGSFSPESWDTNTQAPSIAYINNEKRVKMIYTDNVCDWYPVDCIPGFPVLILKANERLVAECDTRALGKTYTRNGGTKKLRFIDDCFNNIDETKDCINLSSEKLVTRSSEESLNSNDKRIYDAYNIFHENQLGWQRDYLYYNMTPGNEKGVFNNDMNECLIGFEFVANGAAVIDKVCDPEDPQHPAVGSIATRTTMNWLWTDGELEFLVKVYYASKTGAGTEKLTFFTAKPNSLFRGEWQRMNPSDPFGNYKLTGFQNLKLDLNLPLFDWNLDNYSSTIKIAIEEVDNGTSYTTTNTQTVEFSANFGFDIGFGNRVKIGLKFGGTAKKTETVTFTQTVKDVNDALGEVLVNFADDVITSNEIISSPGGGRTRGDRPDVPVSKIYSLKDYNKKYYTGWYRIYLAPRKMN